MRNSRSKQKNPKTEDWTTSFRDRGNLEFFMEALARLRSDGYTVDGTMAIGLVGQRDIPGHTLRLAQSVLRWDIRPSLWSHAFLIAGPPPEVFGQTEIHEVPLHGRSGLFPRPENNGVGTVSLGVYADSKVDANVALIAIQMNPEDIARVKERAADPNFDRVRFDLWESLGIWQGYLWARGARPNPLQGGVPIPASSYAEMAYEAIALDLTPGASERNSAPEHLWNAALWWHEAFSQQGHPISGYCVLRDRGGSMLSTDD